MSNIIDVAKLAGVSVATVSRVINGNQKVKPDTEKRVNEAIKTLGYKPNLQARNLRRLDTGVIMVMLPFLTNPFYSRILMGISDEAMKVNYHVLICQTKNNKKYEEEFLNMLLEKKVDGAILLTTQNSEKKVIKLSKSYPIIQCCEYLQDYNIPHVSINNYQAAKDVMRYLIDSGHSRIAMISSKNKEISTQERVKAYRDELEAAGIQYNEEYFQEADEEYSFNSAQICADKLLDLPERPTAIFCISDVMALSVVRVAELRRIKVPEELSVVGFDNVEYSTMFNPTITTIDQPCYKMGKKAMQMMYSLINDPENLDEMRVFLKHNLIVRESTCKIQ